MSHWVYYSVASGSRIIHPVGHLRSNSILLLYFIILFCIIFNLINLENSTLACGSFYTSLAWKQILNIFLPSFLSLHQIHVSLNCIARMFDVKIAVWVAVLSFIFFFNHCFWIEIWTELPTISEMTLSILFFHFVLCIYVKWHPQQWLQKSKYWSAPQSVEDTLHPALSTIQSRTNSLGKNKHVHQSH